MTFVTLRRDDCIFFAVVKLYCYCMSTSRFTYDVQAIGIGRGHNFVMSFAISIIDMESKPDAMPAKRLKLNSHGVSNYFFSYLKVIEWMMVEPICSTPFPSYLCF